MHFSLIYFCNTMLPSRDKPFVLSPAVPLSVSFTGTILLIPSVSLLSVTDSLAGLIPHLLVCSHEIKRCLLLGRKVMTNLDSILKSRDITLPTKVCPKLWFSCNHVWVWEMDYKESWALKNWCFWTVSLEKTLESLLDCKEIQPVHPKGNQSWIFIGRIDVESETPILWPPDMKSWLT